MNESGICRNFSIAAATYDQGAGIQRKAARALIGRCPPVAENILEAGCGTGALTNLLASTYPAASIVAVDFSGDMLRVARANVVGRNVCFVEADLRKELAASPQFDLIASNAALQWLADDLDAVLRRLCRRLTPSGSLAFSYFGPDTYRELRDALSRVTGQQVRLPSDGFAAPDVLAATVRRHFQLVEVETVDYVETFPTLRALLANVRSTGTRGNGPSPKIAWTPGLLQRVEDDYRQACGEIVVTYQISFCIAR